MNELIWHALVDHVRTHLHHAGWEVTVLKDGDSHYLTLMHPVKGLSWDLSYHSHSTIILHYPGRYGDRKTCEVDLANADQFESLLSHIPLKS